MENLYGYNAPYSVSDVDADSVRINFPYLYGGRLFCSEGNATVRLNGTIYYLVANSSIALMPGAEIAIASVSDNFRGRRFLYTLEFFEQASRGLNGLFGYYIRNPYYIRTRHEVESTYNILDILHGLTLTAGPMMTDRAVCLFRFLLMGICERIPEREAVDAKMPLTTQMTFQRFIFALASKYIEIKTVEGYASILGITSKHLNTVCRNHTDSTAKTVIDNTIMSHIKAELSSTDKTVSEISFLLGFKESTEMCRFFHRIEGITPGQWREKYQQTHRLAALP